MMSSLCLLVYMLVKVFCSINEQKQVLYYVSDSAVFYCNHFHPNVGKKFPKYECDEVHWHISLRSDGRLAYKTLFKSRYDKDTGSEIQLDLEGDNSTITASSFLQADPSKPCAHAIELSNLGKRDMEGRKMKCEIYMTGTNSNGSRVRTKGEEKDIIINVQKKWYTNMAVKLNGKTFASQEPPVDVKTEKGQKMEIHSHDDWNLVEGVKFLPSNITVIRGITEYKTNVKITTANFKDIHIVENKDHEVQWRSRSTVDNSTANKFIVSYSKSIITVLFEKVEFNLKVTLDNEKKDSVRGGETLYPGTKLQLFCEGLHIPPSSDIKWRRNHSKLSCQEQDCQLTHDISDNERYTQIIRSTLKFNVREEDNLIPYTCLTVAFNGSEIVRNFIFRVPKTPIIGTNRSVYFIWIGIALLVFLLVFCVLYGYYYKDKSYREPSLYGMYEGRLKQQSMQQSRQLSASHGGNSLGSMDSSMSATNKSSMSSKSKQSPGSVVYYKTRRDSQLFTPNTNIFT